MNNIIKDAIEFIKTEMNISKFDSAHNWWHVERVYNLAKYIGLKEGGDLFVIQISSLFHDIVDYKFNSKNNNVGIYKVTNFLKSYNLDNEIIDKIIYIINNTSFKEGVKKSNLIELDVVVDADRLDAIGAVGIARAFHYGGFKNNEIYNPNIPIHNSITVEEYLYGKSTTINHFYEKLLYIKENMRTSTGKKLAERKHKFTENYLEEFFLEINLDRYLN